MNPLNPFYLLLLAVAIVGAYYARETYKRGCECAEKFHELNQG